MTSTTRQRVWLAAGVLVLLAGLAVNWIGARGGVDFPSLYVIGRGVLEGNNIYAPGATANFPAVYGVDEPMGMFYPPATGFTMLPFVWLPFGIAKLAWFLVIDITLILGIRALIRFCVPGAADHAWLLCAGVILLSASLRWNMIL